MEQTGTSILSMSGWKVLWGSVGPAIYKLHIQGGTYNDMYQAKGGNYSDKLAATTRYRGVRHAPTKSKADIGTIDVNKKYLGSAGL